MMSKKINKQLQFIKTLNYIHQYELDLLPNISDLLVKTKSNPQNINELVCSMSINKTAHNTLNINTENLEMLKLSEIINIIFNKETEQ